MGREGGRLIAVLSALRAGATGSPAAKAANGGGGQEARKAGLPEVAPCQREVSEWERGAAEGPKKKAALKAMEWWIKGASAQVDGGRWGRGVDVAQVAVPRRSMAGLRADANDILAALQMVVTGFLVMFVGQNPQHGRAEGDMPQAVPW